jgi:hypothetical protein
MTCKAAAASWCCAEGREQAMLAGCNLQVQNLVIGVTPAKPPAASSSHGK